MQDNNTGSTGGARNGDAAAHARTKAEEAKEHLRAAKAAGSDALRGATAEAKTWSRSQMAGFQERIEAEPYKAAAWALGLGFFAGVVITALARSGRR